MEVKSVGTFPVILLKLATPPLPPQQSWIWSKMDENECFFGHNIARGSGGTTGWTQSRTKKLSLGAGFYVTIAWKGFFHTVPSSFVLHCRPLEFEFPLQFPCGSLSTELSDFRQSEWSEDERECKQTDVNIRKSSWSGVSFRYGFSVSTMAIRQSINIASFIFLHRISPKQRS